MVHFDVLALFILVLPVLWFLVFLPQSKKNKKELDEQMLLFFASSKKAKSPGKMISEAFDLCVPWSLSLNF